MIEPKRIIAGGVALNIIGVLVVYALLDARGYAEIATIVRLGLLTALAAAGAQYFMRKGAPHAPAYLGLELSLYLMLAQTVPTLMCVVGYLYISFSRRVDEALVWPFLVAPYMIGSGAIKLLFWDDESRKRG